MARITATRLWRAGVALACVVTLSFVGCALKSDADLRAVSGAQIDIRRDPGLLTTGPQSPTRYAQAPGITFLSPRGNPACNPCGDEDEGSPNEYVFDDGIPARLTIDIRVRVSGITNLGGERQNFQFEIPNIEGTEIIWGAEFENGVPQVRRNELFAAVTLRGLPPRNSAFGRRPVTLKYRGEVIKSQDFEIFYPATACNNDHTNEQTQERIPNWFWYYKDNAGGGDYEYNCKSRDRRSMTTIGEAGIEITLCDEAYLGHSHFLTEADDSTLRIVDVSKDVGHYRGFIAALRHEQYHATHWDEEHREPKQYTIREKNAGLRHLWKEADPNDMTDVEFYANGQVEAEAAEKADVSSDWAHPGSNSRLPRSEFKACTESGRR